jgi:hypothetical protein
MVVFWTGHLFHMYIKCINFRKKHYYESFDWFHSRLVYVLVCGRSSLHNKRRKAKCTGDIRVAWSFSGTDICLSDVYIWALSKKMYVCVLNDIINPDKSHKIWKCALCTTNLILNFHFISKTTINLANFLSFLYHTTTFTAMNLIVKLILTNFL